MLTKKTFTRAVPEVVQKSPNIVANTGDITVVMLKSLHTLKSLIGFYQSGHYTR